MRLRNSRMSSSSKALPKESIGLEWVTLIKLEATDAPIFLDGLSSRTKSGKRVSMASLRALSQS